MSLYDLDPETLELVLELQLQDARSLLKGKYREGEAPDTELAVEMYMSELQAVPRFLSDQTMCRSIARAVELDADTIRMHSAIEEQAIHDREYAQGRDPAITSGQAPEVTPMDDELLGKLKVLCVDEDAPSSDAESSSWASKRGKASATDSSSQRRSCIACCTDVPVFNLAWCPCSHEYCRECLAQLFRASISDESLYPPRCCKQPIPLAINQIFLPSKLVGEFRAKELEYRTPNRTYCHQAACSTFVPPQFIRGDTAICVKCRSETCVMCKGPSHEADCPEDGPTQELLRVAAENGWQRCYSCHRMVELDTGCNHMSRLFHFIRHLYSLTCHQLASAERSSATCAEYVGRIAHAYSGTKTVY